MTLNTSCNLSNLDTILRSSNERLFAVLLENDRLACVPLPFIWGLIGQF